MLAAELDRHLVWRVGCVLFYPDGSDEWFVTVQHRRNTDDIRHLHTAQEALRLVTPPAALDADRPR